ncbi:MAG: GAF domain-containing protein [Anaerolineae bacterium]
MTKNFPNRSLHQQILRRAIPVIVLAFVILGAVAISLYQSNIHLQVEQQHETAISRRANEIDNVIGQFLADVDNLAKRDAIVTFASEALSVTPGRAYSPAQLQMGREFLNIVNENPGQYFSVQFITKLSSGWTNVSETNGTVLTDFRLNPNRFLIDKLFLQTSANGSTTIAPATSRRNSFGGRDFIIRAMAPVFDSVGTASEDAEVIGYIEVILNLDSVLDAAVRQAGEQNWQWYMIDATGHNLGEQTTLRDNDPGLADYIAGNSINLNVDLVGGKAVSTRTFSNPRITDMPWTLILVDNSGFAPLSLVGGLLAIIVLTAAACVATIAFLSRSLRQRLEPLSATRELAFKLAEGQSEATLPPFNTNDELGQITDSFNRMSQRLNQMTSVLDDEREVQKRRLEAASRVSQTLNSIADTNQLLTRAVEVITEEFRLYHAQIFLLDDVGLNAVLVSGYGDLGKKLLEEGYKLPVDLSSPVGAAAATGTPIVPGDHNDMLNPDNMPFVRQATLPDMQSQLALPLQGDNRVVAVLDLYSAQPDAFGESVIHIFQMIGAQLAFAIQKLRQINTYQQRLEQEADVSRQATRAAWSTSAAVTDLSTSYNYNLMEVVPASDESDGDIAAISAPIIIRGEVIGTIAAAAPEGLPFSEGDHAILRAVADRVGLAIEGARLFQETQSTLSLTSMLYQLSRHLNEANELDEVVQAVIQSVAVDASSGQIWLFDDSSIGSTPTWLELATHWSVADGNDLAGSDIRLRVTSSPFISDLRNIHVKVVNDVNRDSRLDVDLKNILNTFHARAAVFVPFSVRGQWRGVLTLVFPQARQFTDSEGRIYSALIDQAGVAIDNRLLTRQTEMTLGQIERLYAASRYINSAQNPVDLLRAVMAASTNPDTRLDFGLLEGALDDTGWPTSVRLVARTEQGTVNELNESRAIHIDQISPLRKREMAVMKTPDGLMTVFPLFSANQPIALLYLHTRTIHELTVEDAEIYRALAGQMSIVLENQRLLNQTSDALDETRRLYTASRAIAGADDAQVVYTTISEHLGQSEPIVGRVTVLLAGPDAGYDALYFEAVHIWQRDTTSDTQLKNGERLSSEVLPLGKLMIDTNDPIYFDDLTAGYMSANHLRQMLQSWGSSSALVVPIRSQRMWFGVIICEAPSRDAFDEAYIRFARAVSDQVGVAVENRQLFEEARSEAQRALALAEVGQLANQIGAEFEQNINLAFTRVAQSANYDRWQLLLLNDNNRHQLDGVIAHNSFIGDVPDQKTFDLDKLEHSVADAIRTNRMLVVNDPARYPSFMNSGKDKLENIGKHIVIPVHASGQDAGVLLLGRGFDQPDIDERDEQLVRTLAAQVAIAIENRQLFQTIEQEREYLRSVLETMPTGIILLDPHTLIPIQANLQAGALLGKPVDYSQPFVTEYYNIIRTGTDLPYPPEEMPVYLAAANGESAFTDDAAIVHEDGEQTDLLLNAAPIRDSRNNIIAIVAAFQNISNLRGLENTLQNSLREQIALYEATRSLSEAVDIDEALDATVTQLAMVAVMDGFIVALDDDTGHLNVLRSLMGTENPYLPDSLFQSEGFFVASLSQTRELDETVRETLLQNGVQSFATVPMRARDSLLGWIVAFYDYELASGNDNERYLTTLADNAAVAIDNRNLQRRTEAAFQEASILYETSRALANITSPEEIVNVLRAKTIMPHVNQIFMAVPSASRTGIDLTVVANWQADQTSINLLGVTLNAEQFPAWRLVSSETLITLDDVSIDTTLDDMERMGLESTDTRALAILPLRSGNRRLGVLWLSSSSAHRHSERDLRIYQSFVEQASLSLEATRLLEQTERRARQLAISAEVSQIANSILDLNVLLPQLVELIREAFGYDHAQIFLMDDNDEFAVLRASTGEAGQQLLAINHKLARGSKSVIGQVTSTGKSVIALDTADARVVHKPNPYLPLTRSELALPLVIKNNIVGALDVQSNIPNAFGDDEMQVLTTLANQISVALDNAQLFEEAEVRARDMGFLFGATAAAADPDKTLQQSLQSVAELVHESIEALNVSIYLSESYTDQYNATYTLLRPTALVGSQQPLSELSEILVGTSNNLLSQLAVDFTPRLITNLAEEPSYLPISTQARSVVAAPMIASNAILGILVLESNRPNAYSMDTLNLLGTLTNSLSAIIQNNRLLEQVQESNDQLRELDRIKSDFLANMSHELRTPLNSIIGFSRVILKGIDGPLTEMQEQDLNTIYNSGTHLLGLINDILDQAKINSGKMDVHADYFDMKPVVEGVRSIAIGLLKDKPVDLKLEVASGLPKTYGDEFRTRQVLLNLVSNASKFTQEGFINIRVYVDESAESGSGMMRVDVHDTGIGIAEKDIPLLFEAFRQVDSSLTRTVGGTGLGLPIAKNLIEMQGGQMLVQSVVNEGSTFSILLPLEPTSEQPSDEPQTVVEDKLSTGVMHAVNAESPAAPASTESEPYTGEITERKRPPGLGKPKSNNKPTMTTMTMNVMPPNRQILLIEDDPDMVDQFRRALQRMSFDIFAASIPLEAEAMASGLRPMLIIMDTDFANGASWDILGRLQNREDTSDIPVIMVSLENVSERAQKAGAFAFVQRPFTPDQLVDTVQKAQAVSQTERILIIDDQPESSRMLQHTLTQSGQYNVFTAESGQEGISLIARRRPNLVILDLRMPERDGFEVLEELRSNPETASIPVMIVTADTLNTEEQGRLGDLRVIYKTDLSQDNYQSFIDGVRDHLGQ